MNLVGAATVLFVASSIGVLFWARDMSSSTHAALLDQSFASIAWLRLLDRVNQVATRDDAGRNEALSLIRTWTLKAPTQEEQDHADRIRRCVATGSCPDGLDAAVEAAKGYYTDGFDEAWKAADGQQETARIFFGLGALFCFSFAGGGLFLVIRMAPKGGAGGADQESADETREEIEVLRQRSEQLYAAQLKAWETERFAAYGEIVAGLSHGLKTPLASIRAAAQLAQAKAGSDSPLSGQFDDIISQTDGLVEQVRRLLQATDTGSPPPVRVSPSYLVAAIDREYADNAAARGVDWQSTAPDDLGDVMVDLGSLNIALRNLVENALAAAPPKSTVAVLARACEPPERAGLADAPPAEGDWIEIVVSDQGPGIPEEVISGHDVGSSKPDGTGIGLAIARRIVARYGGALVCEQGDTGGAVVRAQLPVAETDEAAS